ncbi:hypothetical protein ACJJTC_009264 [Scirpophaga incertulas]
MGKTIHSEARTLILKVLTFFENEKANKRFMIPVDQAIKRACAATGVSKRTLMKIKNESKIVQQNDPPVLCTSVSVDDWKKEINHVERLEKEYWDKDRLQEIEEREFIISLGGEESSSESEIENESDSMSGIEEINNSSEND